MAYIETRPEAIEAIKKAITEKWNLICTGCVEKEPGCWLCEMYPNDGCDNCPLSLSGNDCNKDGSTYDLWSSAENDCDRCLRENGSNYCNGDAKCPEYDRHTEAEAMLEALVQLLPESERAIYGG